MSDTPRTDAALEERHEPTSGLVWGEFARQLERELAEERKQYARSYSAWKESADGLAKQLAEARKDTERLNFLSDKAGVWNSKEDFKTWAITIHGKPGHEGTLRFGIRTAIDAAMQESTK